MQPASHQSYSAVASHYLPPSAVHQAHYQYYYGYSAPSTYAPPPYPLQHQHQYPPPAPTHPQALAVQPVMGGSATTAAFSSAVCAPVTPVPAPSSLSPSAPSPPTGKVPDAANPTSLVLLDRPPAPQVELRELQRLHPQISLPVLQRTIASTKDPHRLATALKAIDCMVQMPSFGMLQILDDSVRGFSSVAEVVLHDAVVERFANCKAEVLSHKAIVRLVHASRGCDPGVLFAVYTRAEIT